MSKRTSIHFFYVKYWPSKTVISTFYQAQLLRLTILLIKTQQTFSGKGPWRYFNGSFNINSYAQFDQQLAFNSQKTTILGGGQLTISLNGSFNISATMNTVIFNISFSPYSTNNFNFGTFSFLLPVYFGPLSSIYLQSQSTINLLNSAVINISQSTISGRIQLHL